MKTRPKPTLKLFMATADVLTHAARRNTRTARMLQPHVTGLPNHVLKIGPKGVTYIELQKHTQPPAQPAATRIQG